MTASSEVPTIATQYPEAQTAIDVASAFTVASQPDYERAVELLREIKHLRKQWDARVRPTMRAAKKAHDEACALFKSVDSKLAEVYDAVKDRCEHWLDDQRRAREVYYRQLSEAAKPAPGANTAALDAAFDEAVANGDSAKAARILDQAALPAALHPAAPVPPPLPAAPPPTVPKVEGTAVGAPWTFEILDASQIPREYLVPDLRKIAAVVKALGDQITIPGVLIRRETSLSIRG